MIYGVTGMPLAGKTTVAEVLQEEGYELVDMGDVVREEMEEREIPAEKTGEFVSNLREENGMDAVAQLTVPRVRSIESEKIVITGMRGLKEKKRFEDELEGEMEMIAVWASPKTRKNRRQQRQREEDIEGQKFQERDRRELEQGVGNLMALSDHMITNEGLKIEELKDKVKEIAD